MGSGSSKKGKKKPYFPSKDELYEYANKNNSLSKEARSVCELIKNKTFKFFGNQRHILILKEYKVQKDYLIDELNRLTNNEYYFYYDHYTNKLTTHLLCIDTAKINKKYVPHDKNSQSNSDE